MNFENLFGELKFGRPTSPSMYSMDMKGNLACQNTQGRFVVYKDGKLTDVSSVNFAGLDAYIVPVTPESLKKGDVFIADDGKPMFVDSVRKEAEALVVAGVDVDGRVTEILPKELPFKAAGKKYLYVSAIVNILGVKDVFARYGSDPLFLSAVFAAGAQEKALEPFKVLALLSLKGKEESDIDPLLFMLLSNDETGMSGILPFLLMGGDGDIDPFMLMALSQNSGLGNIGEILPLILMAGDDIDPMMLAMMTSSGEMGSNNLLPLALMGDDKDINPILMASMMGSGGFGGKGGGGMNAMLPWMLLGGKGKLFKKAAKKAPKKK